MNGRDRFLDLAEFRLHFLEWGKPGARPLMLVHGYLDIAHAWTALSEHLGEAWHIVAPNLRGHGDSGWPAGYGYLMFNNVADLFDLADHLGWATFDLIGHSMGANAAGLMAGTLPDRIGRLILVESFGVPGWTADEAPARLARHMNERGDPRRLANKTFADREAMADRIRSVNVRYTVEHARFLARHGARQLPDGQWTWKFDPRLKLPNPMMYLDDQFRAFWARIRSPTLQVMGGDSPYLPFATPDRWNIPNLRLVKIPGAMHQVPHDQPEAFNRAAAAFLDGAPVGEPWPPPPAPAS